MRVLPVPCLRDNYAYLLDDGAGAAVVVDPSEAAPIEAALNTHRLTLKALWLTHHHWDHVGGIEELLGAHRGIEVIGSADDAAAGRIPRQSTGLTDGARFVFGSREVEAIAVPGHTLGAISYWVDGHVFSGDTLFLAGCGRVFEGTMAQMMASLTRLRALPPETRVWCGHEYTLRNLAFARTIEPNNPALLNRLEHAQAQRAVHRPTVPGTIGEELATNPFFRFDQPAIARGRPPLETFTTLRRAKDDY